MRQIILSTTVALMLTACGAAEPAARAAEDGGNAAAPAKASSTDPITLAVAADPPAPKLGERYVLRVSLTNTGDTAVPVAVPRLGHHSVTVRVRVDGQKVMWLDRLHADQNMKTGELKFRMPEREELAPGASLTRDLPVIAMQPGKHTLTVQYKRTGAPEPLVAAPLEIDVQTAEGHRHVGVQMETTHGRVVVKLRPELAYNTCESFASLTANGYFDGLIFHRIVAGFMAQGGDPKGDGSGGPGYFLPLEAHNDLPHRRGVLSMARTGNPDTGGSQFFLMFARKTHLDPAGQRSPGYTAFGEVQDGDETLRKMEAIETRIPAAMLARLEERFNAEQIDGLVRSGRVEKSQPTERVAIESATLITLE